MHTLIYQHHKPSELMLCNLNSCAASARTSEETSDCRWLASCVVLLVVYRGYRQNSRRALAEGFPQEQHHVEDACLHTR